MSLLNTTEYAGLTIKEWNIVQFSKLSAVLSDIAKEYKARNLSWETFSGVLSTASANGMLDLSSNVMDLLEPFTKHAPTILAISCGADGKKLDSLSFTDGIIATMLVMKANMEHLNRFFVKLVALSAPAEATTDLNSPSNS